MHYNRNMRSRLKIAVAMLFPLAVGAAAQPRVDAAAATAGAGTAGGSAAASVTGTGAAMTPSLTAPALGGPAGLSPAGLAPSAPSAAPLSGAAPVVTPAAAVSGAESAPARLSGARGASPVLSPAQAALNAGPAPVNGAASVRPGAPASPAARGAVRVPGEGRSASAARDGDPAASGPAANSALNGAARKISEARVSEAAGGDELSVAHALDRVFDAQTGAAAVRAAAPGVAGRAQNVKDAITQKVGIANTASPADAPGLYQDAIKTAKDALPASVADAVAGVVRGFASHKADASMEELAGSAYRAAVSGAAPETGRMLAAFDKWETLLGAPGRPLVTNAPALKRDVQETLDKAAAGAAPSAPHVWFKKKDGAYTAVLPGTGVAAIPALAAAFAIAPSALAPETALGDAYRAYSSDPRASSGAALIYRARRALGSSVPSAALSATRFWLRTALESAWRRLVALFSGSTTYRLAEKSGQDALRRDSGYAETARAEAAAAERILSADRLTVSGMRAAFGALGRGAAALEKLSGGSDASAIVESLRRSFESDAASRSLRDADAVPAAAVAAPGGPAHWARRIEEEAARAVDARFWRARGGADFVNLGAESSIAVSAAAVIKDSAGPGASLVALDDRLWARAKGPHGEARLSAELRATSSGGSIELTVQRGDAALARRLEDLGLTVTADGAGLRASAGPQDFARDGDELGLIAARALAEAQGAAPAASGGGVRELADETRRDPKTASRLARLFDGRDAFARAPVIGLVGEYEALAPTSVVIGGMPMLVTALRDPDTRLLAYARAVKPDGALLGAAELRALLLRAK
jgi:hypothetical protein